MYGYGAISLLITSAKCIKNCTLLIMNRSSIKSELKDIHLLNTPLKFFFGITTQNHRKISFNNHKF